MMLNHAKVNYFVKYEENGEQEILPTLIIDGKFSKGVDAMRELSV